MPPKLYFYVNFASILLNKSITSKQKTYARPMLRDIDWETHLVYLEARGFSGFELDESFTCLRLLKNIELLTKEEIEEITKTYPNVTNELGQVKIYKEAYTYLREIHHTNLGKPLYDNEAKDIL
jgi:hypothetical protein